MMWGIGMRNHRRCKAWRAAFSRRGINRQGFMLAEAVATVVITALCIAGFAEALFGALRASQRAALFYVGAVKVQNAFASFNMRVSPPVVDSDEVQIKQQKWEMGTVSLPVGLQATTAEFLARGKEDVAVLSVVTLQPIRHLVEERTP